ncbi:MAG TPA: nitroreductase/quinone reductase family protein [Phototrophicaceae bacterium]|jgi:hypothetical protein|nr:nitroreductase/quinone reductase family protein [Phototrophicaceae bacterium]
MSGMNAFLSVANAVMRFILRSPLHSMVSKNITMITFTGRKSGKIYNVPISYIRDGDLVHIFTDLNGKWWKNLQSGAAVTLLLQGQTLSGKADAVTDQAAVAVVLKDFLERVPRDARVYGITLNENGKMTPEDAIRGAEDTVMIQIQLS